MPQLVLRVRYMQDTVSFAASYSEAVLTLMAATPLITTWLSQLSWHLSMYRVPALNLPTLTKA